MSDVGNPEGLERQECLVDRDIRIHIWRGLVSCLRDVDTPVFVRDRVVESFFGH
jgi:hypothetical protein